MLTDDRGRPGRRPHSVGDDTLRVALHERLSQIVARTERQAARRVIAEVGGIICAHDLARGIIRHDPDTLWWWLDLAEPCWGCQQDMAEDDGEPLVVYRAAGMVLTCHADCFDADEADPWDEDAWPEYPDGRWCLGCDREFTVAQPIPGPRRRYCTPTCYARNRITLRRRSPVTHSCRYCGDEFTGRADALTCSDACRQSASRELRVAS